MNKDNYPALNFPEVYLLEGGYKDFYHAHMVNTLSFSFTELYNGILCCLSGQHKQNRRWLSNISIWPSLPTKQSMTLPKRNIGGKIPTTDFCHFYIFENCRWKT